MADEWHNPDFVRQWDATALSINPTRVEDLDILVSLIADVYKEGTAILDLGIGSGLVEDLLFVRLPTAYVVGIDSSRAMIDLAQARLAPFEDRYHIIRHDLTDFSRVSLPERTYSIVFSVQALHHLPHDIQRELFRSIFTILPPRGIFLLLDRVAFESETFVDLYYSLWNRLERRSGSKTGLSGEEFLQRLRRKEDNPARFEDQLAWLREAGFEATCLHLHLNRVLLVGIKS